MLECIGIYFLFYFVTQFLFFIFLIGKNRANIINKKRIETRFPKVYREKPSLYKKEEGLQKNTYQPN